MKKFLITASVAAVLLIGAVVFVSVTSDDVATAQTAPDGDVTTTHPTSNADSLADISNDTTIGSLVDTALDRAQDLGVLTPEAIDQINSAIDEAAIDLNDMTVGDAKALIAGIDWNSIDWDSIDWDSAKEHFAGEIEGLDLENLELPEGWELPDGFDEKWLDQDWLKDFSFDTFEFPENFNHDDFNFELPDELKNFDFKNFSFDDFNLQDLEGLFGDGTSFGFLDNGIEGLMLDKLRDAFTNGSLEDIFDMDGLFHDYATSATT